MKIIHFLLITTIIIYSHADAQTPYKKPEINQTAAQILIANTGEDSLNSFGAGNARTVISGYGEFNFQRNELLGTSMADFRRAVLFIGHQFNGRIAFFSELELEHAKIQGNQPSGELSYEQAYMKFSINPRQYILAGLILPRIGIINENHLPINFNGVERPQVEQLIIPTTWREMGIAYYRQSSTLPLNTMIALLNGLNNEQFEHGTGIAGARAEGQKAGANAMAINIALQYFSANWKYQLSGYFTGTTPLATSTADSLSLESGSFGTPLYLLESNVQYSKNGLNFKALACLINLPNAASVNKAYNNNAPQQMWGAYGELSYNFLEHSRKVAQRQLNAFARYEMLDLNAKMPLNGLSDDALRQNNLLVGIGYMPLTHVILKADVRLMHTGVLNPALNLNPNPNAKAFQQNNSLINFNIGYSF